MDIKFEKEVCDFLNIPSIPLKEFDGKLSFKDGVAVVKSSLNELSYAICTFNSEIDEKPRIKKVFSQEPFVGIEKIFVVPSYMDTSDIENADLDEQSKEAAKRLAQEANELTEENDDESIGLENQNLSEYFFDNIHNDEEAVAFITSYNHDNGIRGSVPSKHDTIIMRLGVIYNELKKKDK